MVCVWVAFSLDSFFGKGVRQYDNHCMVQFYPRVCISRSILCSIFYLSFGLSESLVVMVPVAVETFFPLVCSVLCSYWTSMEWVTLTNWLRMKTISHW